MIASSINMQRMENSVPTVEQALCHGGSEVALVTSVQHQDEDNEPGYKTSSGGH